MALPPVFTVVCVCVCVLKTPYFGVTLDSQAVSRGEGVPASSSDTVSTAGLQSHVFG